MYYFTLHMYYVCISTKNINIYTNNIQTKTKTNINININIIISISISIISISIILYINRIIKLYCFIQVMNKIILIHYLRNLDDF